MPEVRYYRLKRIPKQLYQLPNQQKGEDTARTFLKNKITQQKKINSVARRIIYILVCGYSRTYVTGSYDTE